jgi:hypothetical protein
MFNHYIRSKANNKIIKVNELVHDAILDSSEASNTRQKIASKFEDVPNEFQSENEELSEPPVSIEINEEFEKEWSRKAVEKPKTQKQVERTLQDPKRKPFQISESINGPHKGKRNLRRRHPKP